MDRIEKQVLVLGAELGADFLKLSSYVEGQNEITHKNYLLDETIKSAGIVEYMETFLMDAASKNLAGYQIVLSGEEAMRPELKKIERCLMERGCQKNQIRIISQENAFVHYVLSQDETIRRHSVLLFDFDGRNLSCYRFSRGKKTETGRYRAEKKMLGSFSLSGTAKTWGKMFDDTFARILKQILTKEVVGAVYLTGSGFLGDWLDKSLRILCDGRRAFMGQNLFSAGCYYYGKEIQEGSFSSFLIEAPETVMYEAGVLDGSDNDSFFSITKAGNAWYDTVGSADIILERSGKVDVVFVNSVTQEKQVESVDVSGLTMRPRKTGRLELKIQFLSSKSGVITVRDKGFGSFVPVTNQVFLKKFTLL